MCATTLSDSVLNHVPSGKQEEVLNILLEDLLEGHAVSETKLKEVLGHTPIQVSLQHYSAYCQMKPHVCYT